MPVSATEKIYLAVFAPGRDANLAVLGKFERIGNEVPEDLRDLALIRHQGRHLFRIIEHEIDGRVHEQGAENSAECSEQAFDIKFGEMNGGLTGLHLGEVEKIVDQFVEAFGGFPDEEYLALLLRGQIAFGVIEQEPGQREDGVQRGAELVTHVGEEAGLHLIGAAQVVGLIVEFGIEGDDAAVGIFEFAVEAHEFVLPAGKFFENAEQLPVLLLHLAERPGRILGGEIVEQADEGPFGDERSAEGQRLGHGDGDAAALRSIDFKGVHQAAGADDTEPHACLGAVAALKDAGKVGDAAAGIDHADDERLGRGGAFHGEFDAPAVAVIVGVACNFGDGGGNFGLLMYVKAQVGSDLPGALTGGYHIGFEHDTGAENRYGGGGGTIAARMVLGHWRFSRPGGVNRATTTVASSVPRWKSRNNTAAIMLGWQRRSPGYLSNDQCVANPSEWRIKMESALQG